MLMSLGTYVNLEQSTDTIVVKPLPYVNPQPIPDEQPPKFQPPAPPATKIPEVVNVVKNNPPIQPPNDQRIEPVEPIAPDEKDPVPKVQGAQ